MYFVRCLSEIEPASFHEVVSFLMNSVGPDIGVYRTHFVEMGTMRVLLFYFSVYCCSANENPFNFNLKHLRTPGK